MGKYIRPLTIFVGGQIVMLLVLLFLPAIGVAGDDLAAETAHWATIGWGWEWVSNSTRLIVFVTLELTILFLTAKAFLSARRT